MENNVSLYLKKYGIALCLIINQTICIYLLSYQSDFKSPRIYLHLITLATIALIAIKYPEYQRIRWGGNAYHGYFTLDFLFNGRQISGMKKGQPLQLPF
jgi:hypothetical protein